MTPAEANLFVRAIDVTIASLHAIRAAVTACIACDHDRTVPISLADPPAGPAPMETAPVVVPATMSSPPRKGGRPRKYFPDRAATATERVALSRQARAAAQRRAADFITDAGVAKPVSQHPLSLVKNSDSKGEREALSPVSQQVSKQELPPDWQPDENGAKLARDGLGNIGAANCLAKFRLHHQSSGEAHTAARWQAKYCMWVRNERGFVTPSFATVSQRALPLVRDLGGGATASNGVLIQQFSPQASAWESHRGKTIPWGKSGTFTFQTEWPPGYEPERKPERKVASG